MKLKTRKANDVKRTYLNMVIMGESGSGKTWQARTLPDIKRTLFVNVSPYEDGTLSVSDLDMDVYDIRAEKGLADATQLMNSLKEDTKYDYVFIDSLTALSKVSMAYAEAMYGEDKNKYKKFEVHNLFLTGFLLDLKTLNKHVILTCLPEVKTSPDGLEVYTFSLDGKAFAKNLEARVDAVLALAVDKGKRYFLTENTGKWVSKVRRPLGVDLDTVIDADIGALMTKLGLV